MYKLSKIFSSIAFFVAFISVIIIGALFLGYEYKSYQENIAALKNNFFEQERKRLQQEVQQAIALINYNYDLRLKTINQNLIQRVNDAHQVAQSLYDQYHNKKPKEEIIAMINQSLQNLRFFDGVGYYFVFDMNAKMLMHGANPEKYNNTYLLKNYQDTYGNYVLKDMIALVQKQKEGFLDWTFYKPKTNEQAVKKGFVKIFEPYNLIIGTADYMFRINQVLQDEAKKMIRDISYKHGGYIFIIDLEKKHLTSRFIKEEKGVLLKDISDKRMKKVLSDIIFALERKDKTFIEYDWKRDEENYVKKLAYLEKFEQWNWIIGTGSFLDRLNEMLKQQKEQTKEKVLNEVFITLSMISIICLGIFWIIRLIAKRINYNLALFLEFFEQLNLNNKKIDTSKVQFQEFNELAVLANEMLVERLENAKAIDTKKKEAQVNLSLLNEYKKAVDEGAIVSKSNVNGDITYVNDEFCKISGFKREELLGKNHNIVRHPDVSTRVFKNLWDTILSKNIWRGTLKNKAKNGNSYYVKSTIVPILDIQGEITEFIAIRYDVSDLIKKSKQIKAQTTDPLTKLPNRQRLLQDIEGQENLKLAIFNIVRFKEVNEYYGFETGDKLLVRLANSLDLNITNEKVNLYRLQGDEYAILAGKGVSVDEFKNLCYDIIIKYKNYSFLIDNNHFDISLVGGASFQPNYYIHAEMAKNHARYDKNDFVFFDDNTSIKENLINNINWTQKLKTALNNNKIVVFTQPIICNNTGKIRKYECLVRLIDEDEQVISPFHFLNVAKKAGLYTKITQRVIAQAFEYFEDKEDDFSINLTIEDILDSVTVKFIYDKLEEYSGISNRVIFEIVEDEGIENYNDVIQFIEAMKYLGCRIAIDDFGTGYSNFDYLMKLNVDFVKIDGSMIKNLDTDENAQIVTELIVRFSKQLGIKTIAEFVHKKEIESMVKKMGIDFSQGYYLGEPKKINS